jgi:hypothetical protein
MGEQPGRTLFGFIGKNSAALIVGVSLILALNFDRFLIWGNNMVYYLSGQATTDTKIEEERRQRYREMVEAQRQRNALMEAERVKAQQAFEEERAVKQEMFEAWQDYLVSLKGKYPQIQIVRDTTNGDYACLLDHPKTGAPSLEQAEEQIRLSLSDEQYRLLRSRRQAEFWNYETQDNIADGFVGWLNSHSTAGKRNWAYDDLQFGYSSEALVSHRSHLDIWNACLWPKEVWRANRYQKRIE